MIAAFMLYCATLGVLLALTSVPLERFAMERGWATRRVWAGALAAAVLLPACALLFRDAPPAFERGNLLVAVSPTAGAVMRGVETLSPLDGVLRASWAAASLLLAALLLASLVATAVRGRRWRAGRVDSVPVLLSADVGPAVVGLLRGRIVVPRWVLALDPTERTMILRHELEHLRAGDPRLLLFGALIAVAMPWNPAVWLMLHRLRLAIEVDCDHRVLRATGFDLRRYAELLLAVGARRSTAAYGMAFSVGRPFLEQRIDRMTLPGQRWRRAHAFALALGVVGVLGVAWSLPQPVRAALVSEAFPACVDDQVAVSRALLTAHDWST